MCTSDTLLEQITGAETLLLRSDGATLPSSSYSVANGAIQSWRQGDMNKPNIGDVMITYEVVYPHEASIVAGVRHGKLVAYHASAGIDLAMVERGDVSPKQMFENAHASNNLRTWLLRGVGFFLMFLGMMLLLNPIVAVFGIVPLLGPLLQAFVGCGVCLAALALSISGSFLVMYGSECCGFKRGLSFSECHGRL